MNYSKFYPRSSTLHGSMMVTPYCTNKISCIVCSVFKPLIQQ